MGLGFGSKQAAFLRDGNGEDYSTSMDMAQPSSVNMAIMNYKNAHGTLLTEFNVMYKYQPKLNFKVGMARFTSVYRLSNSSYANSSSLHIFNDVFKNTGVGANLGIQYQL
jgi:hypothetical protein